MTLNRRAVARAIFSSGSIQFGKFTLKSGVISPYYIDLSRLLSSPQDLKVFLREVGAETRNVCTKIGVNAVASIELRGALLLTALAAHIDLPCFVIRKEAKTYGMTGRIVAGEIGNNRRLLFFDDVITDGQSKIEAIEAIEETGSKVALVMVVVDREQGGAANLVGKGYSLQSMFTVRQLASDLSEEGLIGKEILAMVNEYLSVAG